MVGIKPTVVLTSRAGCDRYSRKAEEASVIGTYFPLIRTSFGSGHLSTSTRSQVHTTYIMTRCDPCPIQISQQFHEEESESLQFHRFAKGCAYVQS